MLFLKYKIVIMRSLGAVMLVVGFAIHFWEMPKEGLSENDKAAARVARMEANVRSSTSTTTEPKKKDDAKFIEKLKNTQEKQMQYLTIMSMILGIGFVGYSFMPKKEET